MTNKTTNSDFYGRIILKVLSDTLGIKIKEITVYAEKKEILLKIK